MEDAFSRLAEHTQYSVEWYGIISSVKLITFKVKSNSHLVHVISLSSSLGDCDELDHSVSNRIEALTHGPTQDIPKDAPEIVHAGIVFVEGVAEFLECDFLDMIL